MSEGDLYVVEVRDVTGQWHIALDALGAPEVFVDRKGALEAAYCYSRFDARVFAFARVEMIWDNDTESDWSEGDDT